MKTIDEDTVKCLKQTVPEWVKAVQHAKAEEANLILTLEAFANDPQLLFDALWFAREMGVTVVLAAPTKEP